MDDLFFFCSSSLLALALVGAGWFAIYDHFDEWRKKFATLRVVILISYLGAFLVIIHLYRVAHPMAVMASGVPLAVAVYAIGEFKRLDGEWHTIGLVPLTEWELKGITEHHRCPDCGAAVYCHPDGRREWQCQNLICFSRFGDRIWENREIVMQRICVLGLAPEEEEVLA